MEDAKPSELTWDSISALERESDSPMIVSLARVVLNLRDQEQMRLDGTIALAQRTIGLAAAIRAVSAPGSIIRETADSVLELSEAALSLSDGNRPTHEELTRGERQWAIHALALDLGRSLKKEDDTYWNYLEAAFVDDPAGEIIVTVQRRSGKTPNQLVDEERTKNQELLADLDVQRAITRDLYDSCKKMQEVEQKLRGQLVLVTDGTLARTLDDYDENGDKIV